MLSLTKINSAKNQKRSAKSGDGYLFYIQSPSTRERSDFVEYLRSSLGQPAPFWAGDGARLLGLGDAPEPEHVERLAHGFHPLTGEPLVQGAGDRHVMGLDMTFSAPKDVSAAFAAADAKTQREIIACLQEAARAALRYAESGALTRHEKGGRVRREADATLAACHTHFASRSLDPQLHVHAFLLNVGKRRGSNEWSALELRPQFERKLATGAMFRAELAWRMRELGFAVVADGPYFNLAGISDAQREALSTRSRQIREHLDKHAAGNHGAAAKSVAALNTRAGKAEPPLPELLALFKEQAASVGLDASAVARMRASPRIDPTAELSAGSLSSPQPFMIDHGELLDELTSNQSCFTPQEALAHICAMAMGRWSSAECLAELGGFLQTDQVVALGATEQNTPVFTSRATQELETLATDRVRRGADNTRHQIDERLVEARFDALERELGARLNAPVSLAQQRAAALHVASRTGDHAFVEGWAGAGKTTLLKALGEAYVDAGFKLVGCAQSAAAAQNLARETGIESRTIASLLLALRNGRAKLSERSVLLLDEAGMVGSREFAMLQDAAIAAGAKFISVGDSKQLQPIAAGGIFRALVNMHGAAEISAIQRQRTDFGPLLDWLDKQSERGAGITPQQAKAVRELPESERLAAAEAICQGSKRLRAAFERWRAKYDHEWLRLAVEQLAMGEALPALRLMDSRGRLMLLEGQESALAAMVDAWSADKTPLASKAMIAGTRAEVAELNRRARERLVDAGAVLDHAGAEIIIRHRDGATETKRFAAGDRIVFTQNDREIGVANGVAGTVKKIDKVRGDLSLVVELDVANLHGDRRVVVPASFACFDLGYCLTNHKIQSRTYDAAYALASPTADREWIYVAASRSRFATTIFIDASMIGAADPESHLANRERLTREQRIEALARGLSRSHAKGTTLDYRNASDREPANHATKPMRDEQAKASADSRHEARPPASKSRRGQRGAQREKVSESDRRAATAFCEALSIGKQAIATRQEPRR